MYVLRFDMRAPSLGASTTELYAAALEMAQWSESRGALMAVVCEHHTMEDGYLPSPLVVATALAARTTTLPIMVAVVILPLYEPVRLAEDMVGLDFIGQGGDQTMEAAYAEESRANGHEPGFCLVPPVDTVTTLFVAHDVDRAWDELGPHLLHDVKSYASVNEGNTHTASITTASTVEELRAEDRSHRIVTVDEAVEMMRAGVPLQLQPLVGGLPPETAWRYLRTVTDEVMPAISQEGT